MNEGGHGWWEMKEREWKTEEKKIDTGGAPYQYGIEMNLVVYNNCTFVILVHPRHLL